MRAHTKEECQTWLAGRERQLPDKATASFHHREVTKDYRAFAFAHWFATQQTYNDAVLLWMTEWGIWPTSENWHAYYTLRRLCGDTRLLHEAPGHLFLKHEMEECATFLQLSLLNGWGGYILTQANYVNAFFSHDEYIDFFSESGQIGEVKAWFS